jgi:hypothetical protein
VASRTGRVNAHVANLTAEAPTAQQRSAPGNDPAADADLAGDINEVRGTGPSAGSELGQRSEVRIVANEHRGTVQAETVMQRRAERVISPLKVRRLDNDSFANVHQSGDCGTNPDNDWLAIVSAITDAPDCAMAEVDRGANAPVRAGAHRVKGAFIPVDLTPAKISHQDRDIVDVHFETDRKNVTAVDIERRARPPNPPQRADSALPHQAEFNQLRDQTRHRPAGQPRAAGQIRARQTWRQGQQPQRELEVVAANDGVVCASGQGVRAGLCHRSPFTSPSRSIICHSA